MTHLVRHIGNIFDSSAPALGHGINTQGQMGAGIAAQFAKRYPDMKEAYTKACAAEEITPGSVWYWHEGDLTICNIASQRLPGADARLHWLKTGVGTALDDLATFGKKTLAIPEIGCGIGGLFLADVLPLLIDLAAQSPVDIELWSLPIPAHP